MKVKSLEPTPNPNAFKFNLEEQLTRKPRSFSTSEAAANDPLASLLFEIEGVESVFYMDSFVTISKEEEADWEAVMIETGQRLIDFNIEDLPQVAEEVDEEGNLILDADLDEETKEVLRKINVVIDEMVRPALAGDGGGLEVLGLDDNTVFIRYQGACGSCPSATTGTLMAIERLIQHQIAPDLQVLPA